VAWNAQPLAELAVLGTSASGQMSKRSLQSPSLVGPRIVNVQLPPGGILRISPTSLAET